MIRARPVPPVAPRMAMCCGEGERVDEMLRRDNMVVVAVVLVSVVLLLDAELYRVKCDARGIKSIVVFWLNSL